MNINTFDLSSTFVTDYKMIKACIVIHSIQIMFPLMNTYNLYYIIMKH